MRIYSVRDVKAQTFSFPFVAKNDDVAIRLCKVDAEKNNIHIIKDQRLYVVAEFDLDSGVVSVPTGAPEEVCSDLSPYPMKKRGNSDE